MRIGSRRFAPRLWAVVLYLSVLACMLWLGNWQLNRAALKVTLQQSAQRAQSEAAVPIASVQDIQVASEQYRRVRLRGRYDAQRQFLWDNRTHKGQAGYEVISLLRLDDGLLALVNRGWVAPGPTRQQLPDVSYPAAALVKVVEIEGYLSRPSKGFASGEAVTGDESWPKLLQYLDYDAISATVGEPIIASLVQSQTLVSDASATSALTPRPEWLKANWQPAASGPAKHYSYAFQWFAMAVALTGIFLIVNTRKIALQAGEGEQSGDIGE